MARLGIFLRNMGPQATRDVLLDCARRADDEGIDDLWLADHVAIPPEDSQGSEGRYLDPLATIAFLAAVTTRVHLGTGVLVLPYRPALPTAKWLATIQELSGGRLLFGVGAGWMEPEFRALGVPHASRGRITDTTLDLVHRAFADDEVVENGQRFLFRPRPQRPPIFVGGGARVGIPRAARHGEGWMPSGGDPDALAADVPRLRRAFEAASKPSPEVVVLTSLPMTSAAAARERASAFVAAGATRIVHAERYGDGARFAEIVRLLTREVGPALSR